MTRWSRCRTWAAGALAAGLTLVMAGPIGAAPVDIRLEPLNARFEQPVHITYAPGDPNHLWIVEQPGTVRVYDLESDLLLPTPFLSIPEQLAAGGERGLLSLAFHPDFQDNGRFFVNYTDRAGNTQVVEYRVGSDPLVADPATARRLLTIEQPAPNHNGGMMAFGPDGYLYIGTGDGGRAGDPWNNAQNLGTLLGKLLRIDVDRGVPYGIPPDNPFAGRPGARGEIWAYGLRNPWKFSFDRATGDLYIADVGQNLWEEINFEPAAHSGGRNYGWNRMEGAHCYPGGSRCDTRGLVMPVAEYRHRPDMGCSITGGYVYRGRAIPKLYGYYVFSDYCSGRIWAMSTAPAAAYGQGGAPGGMWPYEDLARTSFRITAFGEDLAGELYVADHSGRVFRLLPTAQR